MKEIISSKIPNTASIGTGFVVCDNDNENEKISSQIDIIVYRADSPVLLKKGDFVIVSNDAVLGIIEVKTKLNNSNLKETFSKAHENGRRINNPYIFNGIFSYECDFDVVENSTTFIENSCKSYPGFVNNVSFGANYFMKFWPDGKPNEQPKQKYRIYEIENLSFGYFISNLIEDIYVQLNGRKISKTMANVMYPIENTKEAYEIKTINV